MLFFLFFFAFILLGLLGGCDLANSIELVIVCRGGFVGGWLGWYCWQSRAGRTCSFNGCNLSYVVFREMIICSAS